MPRRDRVIGVQVGNTLSRLSVEQRKYGSGELMPLPRKCWHHAAVPAGRCP